jgi:hypothetical protein
MRSAAFALVACLCAGPALAQTPPRAPPTEVSPLTVMPRGEPPKVTATFPAAGQAVAPGVLVLKVTFDQKMLETGFDFAPAAGGEMPQCLKTPRLLDDGKTFVLLCRTLGAKRYALAFNGKPAGGFASLADTRAQPAGLAFTTTDGDPVADLKDALKAASLRDVDVPVQDTPVFRHSGGS